MAARNLTKPSKTGTAAAMLAASAGGDSFPLSGGITVRVKNAHATLSRTITIVGQQRCNFGVLHNATVTVPALDERVFEIAGSDQFRDAQGRVQLTYSTEADLTLEAYPS